MRYERPRIVRREPVGGLADTTKSDKVTSDAASKDNVVPVVWRDGYQPPAVARREAVAALGDTTKSDPVAPSDAASKEHVVPVRWDVAD